MNVMWAILAIALPAAGGIRLARWILGPPHDGAARAFYWILGTGIGIGAASVLYFAWIAAGGAAGRWPWVESGGIAVVLLAMRRSDARAGNRPPAEPMRPGRRFAPVVSVLIWIAAGTVIARIAWFIAATQRQPHGHWDAWAIWNLRARFLFRNDGAAWRDGFSPPLGWSHPDYPLLLPASVARCWAYVGTDSVVAPALLHGLATFGTCALVGVGVAILRGRLAGLAAGLLMVSSTGFARLGVSQLADVTLAFFMLGAAVLLALRLVGTFSPIGAGLLGGAMSGLAAWTKNEGILFLIVATVGWAFAASRNKTFRREIGTFVAGAALPALALLYFKLTVAPPGDLFRAHQLPDTLSRLFDGARHWAVAKLLAGELSAFVLPASVLAATVLTFGIDRGSLREAGVAVLSAVLATMSLGYFLVYVTTPHDLQYHVTSSAARLIQQLWPLASLVGFLLVRRVHDETHAPALAVREIPPSAE